MFDIFETDTRDVTASGGPSPENADIVAVEAPSIPAMSAQASTATTVGMPSTAQIEEVKINSGTSVHTSDDACLEPPVDHESACLNETTEDVATTTFEGPVAASQESAATCQEIEASQEPAATSQKPTEISEEPAETSQEPAQQQSPEFIHDSISASPEASVALTSSSNTSSDSEVQQILDGIPFRDYHPNSNLLELRDGEEFYSNGVTEAAKADDGMFESATELDWKISLRKILISCAIREQENKDWNEQNRLKYAFPAAVVQAKNATDPRIYDVLQSSAPISDCKADLKDAIEGWRDTIDGRKEAYDIAASGKNPWKYMDREDFDGIDNNEFHDYFPEASRKVVCHSTAVQTQLITSPLVHQKVYGMEPTKAELRKLLRRIGAPEYVDQSELWYGQPFLGAIGQYLDVESETQDSGFQTTEFDIREANIVKAKAKAGITASRLNKLSHERRNGIRVFVEPSKDRVVHSQQFTTLRAVVDKAGTVESYGSFTPLIHNVVYENIEEKPEATITQVHAIPLTSPALPKSQESKAKTEELENIISYCRSPSPSPYEDAQIDDPELFENGWPSELFPLRELDGTYSQHISNDFSLPDATRFHKSVPEHTHAFDDSAESLPRPNVPVAMQHTSGTPHIMGAQKTLHTPEQREGKGNNRKRSLDGLSDEGYKSHSSSSSSKRQRHKEHTVASSSQFSTPYNTPISSDALKVPTPTSTPSNANTASVQTSSKRKRATTPNKDEPAGSKRVKLNPTPTPIRRLPPTESTLKVFNPKGNTKAKVKATQGTTQAVPPQTTQKAPIDRANAKPEKTQGPEPARQQAQQSTPPPLASAAPRPAWADRKPTANRNSKENPNRWRLDLGGVGLGRRHEPYNASGRPQRRN